MQIRKGYKYSYLIDFPSNVIKFLIEGMKVKMPGYQYTTSFVYGWDGYKHFMSKNGRFLSGLVAEVSDLTFSGTGSYPKIVDERKKPISIPMSSTLNGIILRDYQEKAASEAIDYETSIIKAATNAGKTEIMAEIIRRLNIPTLILVHRKELLYQTVERLRHRLSTDEIGLIGDSNKSMDFITVGMPQSMTKKSGSYFKLKNEFNPLKDTQLLILDECHIIGDLRVQGVVSELYSYYKVGMSGTPFHNEPYLNKILKGWFGSVSYEISNTELIDSGFSSVPYCYFLKFTDNSIPESIDYPIAYSYGITNSIPRNSKVIEAVNFFVRKGKQILLIVREIEHGSILQSYLPDAVFIHGSLNSKERKNAIDKFKAGSLQTLISSTILDEGIDISNIDVLIVAAGGQAPKRVLQRIGRGLRKKESNQLIVIDFADKHNSFLKKHYFSRMRTMKNENFFVSEISSLSNIEGS